MTRLSSLLLATLLATACSQQAKAPVDDDFSSLSGMDQKSDSFSYRMSIVGSLDFGQTSDPIAYTKSPRYRAIKFAGHEGDKLDIWVRSADGGDAVAWVLDNGFHVLGSNDDAAEGGTLDSHISVTLPASTSITHYVVLRDYDLLPSTYTVELDGPTYSISCAHDSDCVAVNAGGCCPDGTLFAVNASTTDEYAEASTCRIPPHLCPQHMVLDTRVAECDVSVGTCGMVAIEDIACGAHSTNSHACPDGYTCNAPGTDAAGHCVAQ